MVLASLFVKYILGKAQSSGDHNGRGGNQDYKVWEAGNSDPLSPMNESDKSSCLTASSYQSHNLIVHSCLI